MDTVVSQSVDAGTTADVGTTIDVEVSDGKGKEMKTVPMLIGLDVDTAKSTIVSSGFKVGNILYEESSEYAKNVVTSQQYKKGRRAGRRKHHRYRHKQGRAYYAYGT